MQLYMCAKCACLQAFLAWVSANYDQTLAIAIDVVGA